MANGARINNCDGLGGPPSRWVAHFLEAAREGAANPTALDVAAGGGRHARLAGRLGFLVTAVDRNIGGLADLSGVPGFEIIEADLEDGSPWPLAGRTFGAVIVTNYLYRPRLPAIVAAVAPDGVLVYETFAAGNERFGKPSNPDFLLRPAELLHAIDGRLTPFAFETVIRGEPPSIVQRIAAAGPAHRWHLNPPQSMRSTP